jgi:1-acyl-sn-glycerol-3-phosphate acyltransferase
MTSKRVAGKSNLPDREPAILLAAHVSWMVPVFPRALSESSGGKMPIARLSLGCSMSGQSELLNWAPSSASSPVWHYPGR